MVGFSLWYRLLSLESTADAWKRHRQSDIFADTLKVDVVAFCVSDIAAEHLHRAIVADTISGLTQFGLLLFGVGGRKAGSLLTASGPSLGH